MLGLPEKLLIFGGDGERDNKSGDGDGDGDGNDNQQQDADKDKDDKDKDKGKGKSGDSGAADDKDDPGSGSGSDGDSPEDQLDAEKRKNLSLQKQINALTAEQAKTKDDKDVAAERDKLKGENDKLKGVLDKNFLAWKIAQNKKYDWADAADIPLFIKPDEISIDLDKEEIEGLDLALKRIAKEKPHLLKKDDEQDDDADNNPSGSHPRGGKTDQGDTEDDRIRKRFRLPGYGSQAVRPL